MVRGTLEVLLVGAKGLENTDFLSKFALSNTFIVLCRALASYMIDSILVSAIDPTDNMDPYAVITCRTQEQKSSVSTGLDPSLFKYMLNFINFSFNL